jgi:hypothetical protein
MIQKLIIKTAVLATVMVILPTGLQAETWTTTAQYGQYDFANGYAVNNDCWGSDAGPQTLYVDTTSEDAPHFWATSDQNGGDNVETYPDARIDIGVDVLSLGKLVGAFDTGANEGQCDFAFDCWIPSEVMVWTQWTSGSYPDGSLYQSNVTISGVTYNVYHGTLWSFLRTSQTSSGEADLAGIFKWLVNNGLLANGTVGSCQYGVEIRDGSSTWTVHSCSITQ